MEYKGFYARIEFSEKDKCFFGTITGIAAISFEGNSAEELRVAFNEAVEDYLAMCKMKDEEYKLPFLRMKVNLQTIKNFNLDEMAKFLSKVGPCHVCIIKSENNCCEKDCVAGIQEYLKLTQAEQEDLFGDDFFDDY